MLYLVQATTSRQRANWTWNEPKHLPPFILGGDNVNQVLETVREMLNPRYDDNISVGVSAKKLTKTEVLEMAEKNQLDI